MFKFLVFENANSKTRPLLITLGKDADVAEMIDMATRASQSQQGQVVTNAVAEAVKPATNLLAAAVSKISQKLKSGTSNTAVCYPCGAKGHFKKMCQVSVWCDRCQKDNHSAATCRFTKKGLQSAKSH